MVNQVKKNQKIYSFNIVGGIFVPSVSDLSMPVNELVRLVRVYSTPWEEKSAALKKLHEDYESKQRQLNIAIKRLQLVDAHVSGKTAVAGIFSSSDDDYNNHFSSFAKVTFILLFCLFVMFSFSFLVLVCSLHCVREAFLFL